MITDFGDKAFDAQRGPVALLFSGGVDSTLAALRLGRRHPKVHLLTFTAPGLAGAQRAALHLKPLGRFYADPARFEHHVLPVDVLVRTLSDAAGRRGLVADGLLRLSHRELSRLAFHARALAFCLDRGVRRVADGTCAAKQPWLAHDEALFVDPLRALYAAHGIEYETPVWNDGATSEAGLWALRYSRHAQIRGTDEDRQVTTEWDVLQRMVDTLRGTGTEARAKARDFLAARFALLDGWARAATTGDRARAFPALQEA